MGKLERAVRKGDIDTVRKLLNAGADVNSSIKIIMGTLTPLHIAATHESTDIARVLLDAGADANARSSLGTIPLHNARYVEVTRVLLDAGADVNARDDYGRTPLHGDNYSTEMYRDRYGKVARVLLDAGADINAKDIYGRTPLHHACHKHEEQKPMGSILHGASVEVARFLVDAGADINAKDIDLKTPLDVATVKVAKLLRERGAMAGNAAQHFDFSMKIAGTCDACGEPSQVCYKAEGLICQHSEQTDYLGGKRESWKEFKPYRFFICENCVDEKVIGKTVTARFPNYNLYMTYGQFEYLKQNKLSLQIVGDLPENF